MKKLMRYYKNYSPLFAVGAILLVAGALIYCFSNEIWALSYPILAIGFALVIIGCVLRVSDAAYVAYFTSKVEDTLSDERFDTAPDYTAKEFSFDGNTLSKLDGGQRLRSELYVNTDIYFGRNELTVVCCRVNLLEDSAVKEKLVFPLSEVTAVVEERETRVAGVLKKVSVMTVSDPASSVSFPVHYNDIDVDSLASRINDAKTRGTRQ